MQNRYDQESISQSKQYAEKSNHQRVPKKENNEALHMDNIEICM